MIRRWCKQVARFGLIGGVLLGGAVAGLRLIPRLIDRRNQRHRESAIRATEGLWPPVPTSTGGKAKVQARQADGTTAGSDDADQVEERP